MKTTYYNQEILLHSKSSFFKRDFAEKRPAQSNQRLSQADQIAMLCWNGLLPDLLPEIVEKNQHQKPLTIWEINATHHLIDLRLGEINANLNTVFSINPYVYLALMEYN